MTTTTNDVTAYDICWGYENKLLPLTTGLDEMHMPVIVNGKICKKHKMIWASAGPGAIREPVVFNQFLAKNSRYTRRNAKICDA